MIEDDDKRVKEKLRFFHEEQVPVHITRMNKEFWNGILVSQKSDDVWIFQERKLGEVFLFISDIFDVEQFRGDTR